MTRQGHGEGRFSKLGITSDLPFMNCQIFAVMGLLLVASCTPQPKSHMQDSDSAGMPTNGVLKNQEAIAKEIVSIEYAFGNAVVQLNDTNAVSFVAEVKSLSDRLDKISKELDTLGPFPAGLREATLKKLDDDEKAITQVSPSRTTAGSLQPEAVKIIEPAVDRYFSARASVVMKAGVFVEAKGGASGESGSEMTNGVPHKR